MKKMAIAGIPAAWIIAIGVAGYFLYKRKKAQELAAAQATVQSTAAGMVTGAQNFASFAVPTFSL